MSKKVEAITMTHFGQVDGFEDSDVDFGSGLPVYKESFISSDNPYVQELTATADKPYKDPYYDETQRILISPDDVTGRTQRMAVTFIDSDFTKRYHVQWIDENKLGEYQARGFQFVKREWVGSSWTHALTGSNNDQSDKVRMAVTIAEAGHVEYNVLMFTKREIFDRMQFAAHNEFNRVLLSKDTQLEDTQKNHLDEKWIRSKHGY